MPKLSKPLTYYWAFIDRYITYLSLYQIPTIPQAIERLNNYINQYAQIYNYKYVNMKYTIDSKNIDFPFLLELIKNILEAKQHIIKNPSLYKFNLLFAHGKPIFESFIVPQNLLICVITPLNYMLDFNINSFNNLLENFKNPIENKKFLDNPSCYIGSNINVNRILQHKTLYYSGQRCPNIELAIFNIDNDFAKNTCGYYSHDDIQKVDTNIVDITYPRQRSQLIGTELIINTKMNPPTKMIKTTLNMYVDNIKGVLFVLCCRTVDTEIIDNNIPYPNMPSKKISFLYQINILHKYLNKTIDNIKTENYNDCYAYTNEYMYEHQINLIKNNKIIKNDIFYKQRSSPLNHNKFMHAKFIKTLLNLSNKINRSQKSLDIFDFKLYFKSLFIDEKHIQNLKRKIDNILSQNINSGKLYKIFNSIFKFNLYNYSKNELTITDINELLNNFCSVMNFNYAMSYILYVYNTLKSIYLISNNFITNIIKIINSDDKYIYEFAYFQDCGFIKFSFINNKIGENIKLLNIDNNNLTDISFICECPKLEYIFASHNNVLFIPNCIINLKFLNEINLVNNPKLLFTNIELSPHDNYNTSEREILNLYNMNILLMSTIRQNDKLIKLFINFIPPETDIQVSTVKNTNTNRNKINKRKRQNKNRTTNINRPTNINSKYNETSQKSRTLLKSHHKKFTIITNNN